jgi:hypothetical protein
MVGHHSSKISAFKLAGGMAKTLNTHKNTIKSMSLNHIRRYAVTCSSDQVVVWTTESWKRVKSLFPQTKDLVGARVSADG